MMLSAPRSSRLTVALNNLISYQRISYISPLPRVCVFTSTTQHHGTRSRFSTTARITVPRERVTLSFTQSGGPGGQNVNKVNTKVELRFSLADSDWIPSDVKERLIEQNPNMVTSAGHFVMTSSRHRTQMDNIKDVMAKLEALLAAAQVVPKARIATKTPHHAIQARLTDKKHRSATKRGRTSSSSSRDD